MAEPENLGGARRRTTTTATGREEELFAGSIGIVNSALERGVRKLEQQLPHPRLSRVKSTLPVPVRCPVPGAFPNPCHYQSG
ncbi:hypothetical protein CRG98_043268 [Punica granatum]|uniref:Uncharacterized protein n=1 Tax=Punica granatum TaxID=22663 RepID=A0A2I0HXA5_PUNGR|nr:hypothetical protein CRG98_043268 [Punica granatum]